MLEQLAQLGWGGAGSVVASLSTVWGMQPLIVGVGVGSGDKVSILPYAGCQFPELICVLALTYARLKRPLWVQPDYVMMTRDCSVCL